MTDAGAAGSRRSEPELPGPFAVGRYARKLQEELRRRARVRLVGEVTGVSRSKVQAYFELRDGEGAVPCAIWLDDLERAGLPEGGLRDGAEVVIAGGPDYYPGGAQASPSFSFRATYVRLAGEGDLLARLEALRKQLRSEGLFELQKQLGAAAAAAHDRRRHRRVAAPRGATSSPAFAAVAGRGPSSGGSRRSRIAAPRRRSPRRSATSRPGPRSRRSSSPGAAAASPTSGRSATRPSAARSPCSGCR